MTRLQITEAQFDNEMSPYMLQRLVFVWNTEARLQEAEARRQRMKASHA